MCRVKLSYTARTKNSFKESTKYLPNLHVTQQNLKAIQTTIYVFK